jgi:hypothetical protein
MSDETNYVDRLVEDGMSREIAEVVAAGWERPSRYSANLLTMDTCPDPDHSAHWRLGVKIYHDQAEQAVATHVVAEGTGAAPGGAELTRLLGTAGWCVAHLDEAWTDHQLDDVSDVRTHCVIPASWASPLNPATMDADGEECGCAEIEIDDLASEMEARGMPAEVAERLTRYVRDFGKLPPIDAMLAIHGPSWHLSVGIADSPSQDASLPGQMTDEIHIANGTGDPPGEDELTKILADRGWVPHHASTWGWDEGDAFIWLNPAAVGDPAGSYQGSSGR